MDSSTLERLYRDHNTAVVRAVASRSRAYREIADDAAAAAWLILATRPDDYLREETALGWLVVVARREAYRLLFTESPTVAGGRALSLDDDHGQVVDHRADLETHLEARELLRAVAQLRPSRRAAITARLAGFSYHETEHQTGMSYTAVNRGTTEGRAELRDLLR